MIEKKYHSCVTNASLNIKKKELTWVGATNSRYH